MDKFLLQAFQNLPEVEVGNDLHVNIFRAAAFRRSWKYVSIITILIAFTFIFSLWQLYTRAVEIDALSSLKAIFNSLDFSFNSITGLIKSFVESLPIQSITITILNLTTLVFMTFLMRSFSRLQTQFKM